jgi:hypothetical protein
MATLVPILTGGDGTPKYNLGIAETYSWIPIANDQNRPMFARANYITNLTDLTVSISAGSFDIGAVNLLDKFNGNYATISQIGLDDQSRPIGAVNVLTQDLDSNIDDITIGDKSGNFATVFAATSSLNVNVTNFTAVTSNQATTNNQIVTNTLLNAVTANQVTLTEQLTGITILNPTTSVTVSNQITGISVKNTVTNWDTLTAISNNNSFVVFPSNIANTITILNTTGETIFVKNASKTIAFPLANNISVDLQLIGNTNEVAVKTTSLPAATIYATFVALQ